MTTRTLFVLPKLQTQHSFPRKLHDYCDQIFPVYWLSKSRKNPSAFSWILSNMATASTQANATVRSKTRQQESQRTRGPDISAMVQSETPALLIRVVTYWYSSVEKPFFHHFHLCRLCLVCLRALLPSRDSIVNMSLVVPPSVTWRSYFKLLCWVTLSENGHWLAVTWCKCLGLLLWKAVWNLEPCRKKKARFMWNKSIRRWCCYSTADTLCNQH